jgi:hypothetical protein
MDYYVSYLRKLTQLFHLPEVEYKLVWVRNRERMALDSNSSFYPTHLLSF